MSSLADFLFSENQQRVLALLYLKPEEWRSLSEIIRASGNSGFGATHRYVQALAEAGALEERYVGNQHQYRVNQGFPLYAELRGICLKSFGLRDRIRDALLPVVDQITEAFIFGSVARHEDKPGSDIDLFVIGAVDYFELMSALAPAEKDLGRPIHTNLHTEEEFASLSDDSIMNNILHGSLISVIEHGPDRLAKLTLNRRGKAGPSGPRRRRAVSEKR